MTRALFSKLSFSPLLVIAGLSGCGDSGNSNTQGTDPYNQGGYAGYGGQPMGQPCQNLTIQPCTCNGAPGVQRCENSVWGVCTCGSGQGTGGFGGGVNPPPGGGGQGNPGQFCNDGLITGTEQCDGQNHAGQDCASWTMGSCTGGPLACGPDCMFDISRCTCGGGNGGSGGTFGTGGTVGAGGNVVPVGGNTGQP